jgi:endoglucanase
MDKIIAAAGADGLKVILDDHRSEAGDDNERNGLWYTEQYPESSWIADWQTLAARYRNAKDAQGNPIVIGMDLRNEPFMMVGSSASGACWTGDTASAGCPSTNVKQNWPAAASRAGAAILAVDPNLLIFVEGTDCYDGSCDWQGGNLAGAGQYPVELPVAGRLVYSTHEYGPDVSPQPWFNPSTTSGTLQSLWIHNWAYLSMQKIAPVWVGEFGTTNNPKAIQSNEPGSQGQWFSSLVDFLGKEKQISWTYWAVNGEDDLGVLGNSYDPAPASSLKHQELQSIQFPLNELGKSNRAAIASGE